MVEENTQHNPEYLAVGRVLGPHGLRGEVKVELHTDFPERLQAGRTLYLGNKRKPVKLTAARPHQSMLLLTFEDFADRNATEILRREWLYIPASEAAPLETDQYFVHQIVGLRAVTTTGRLLGTISEVLVTGANDVYVIQKTAGGELLIPALEEVVKTVDLAAGQMTVELLPGLEDEKTEPEP